MVSAVSVSSHINQFRCDPLCSSLSPSTLASGPLLKIVATSPPFSNSPLVYLLILAGQGVNYSLLFGTGKS